MKKIEKIDQSKQDKQKNTEQVLLEKQLKQENQGKKIEQQIQQREKTHNTQEKQDNLPKEKAVLRLKKKFIKIKDRAKNWRSYLTKERLKIFFQSSWNFLTFGFLLIIYLVRHIYLLIKNSKKINSLILSRLPPVKFISDEKINIYYEKLVNFFDRSSDKSTISRVELMEIAVRNLETKKTRSIITIGGMAVGIGAIVFLVSIGYGLQDLVISRVARLEEMRQLDITTQTGSNIKINDSTIKEFQKINKVEKVLPLIGVVSKVSYNLSSTDMPAYGVTADYLVHSAIKPVRGKIFKSNHITLSSYKKDQVMGVTTKEVYYGQEIGQFRYSIYPGEWVKVRLQPNIYSQILGYTKRVSIATYGVKYLGSYYQEAQQSFESKDGEKLAYWYKANIPLWEKTICDKIKDNDCIDGSYKVLRDETGAQINKIGYFADIYINSDQITENKDVFNVAYQSVLGTSSAQLTQNVATSSSLVDVDLEALIASEAGLVEEKQTKVVSLGEQAYKQAIVNRAMLKVLGIKEETAVGKRIEASFIVVGDITNSGEKIKSEFEEYEIIAVIPSEKSPFFYIPLIDLRSIGIDSFSQVKILAEDQNSVELIRKEIEGQGFSTASVIDTVAQINNLFSSARLLLALLGTVALAVAALGMFNTLTVSLLERTHEVGLMKAMGMKSHEVQELFLTESMVMGFAGGILGIFIGFVAGKIIGILLSIFSLTKGAGTLDISSIPLPFTLLILFLSVFVGFFTGIYPARRAKRISALDALRYE